MGSVYPFDPGGVPAVPDIPPASIGVLAVGLCDLFGQAHGLVLPRHVMITESSQEFALQFAPATDSAKVLMSWAMRFGGVVSSHLCDAPGSPHTHIILTFEFYGVTAEAYTFIPLTVQEDQS